MPILNAIVTLKRKGKSKDADGYKTTALTEYLTQIPCLLGVTKQTRSTQSEGRDSLQNGIDAISIYKNLPEPIQPDDIATVLSGGVRQDYVVTSARSSQALTVSHWKLELKPMGKAVSADKVGSFLQEPNGNVFITATGSEYILNGNWYKVIIDDASDGVQTVYTLPAGKSFKQIFINGVLQSTDDYTINVNVLTLDEAAPVGTEVSGFYFA